MHSHTPDIIFFKNNFFGQDISHTVYLIPGIGSDGRIFRDLKIENCDTVIINFIIPEKNEILPDYAKRMVAKIFANWTFDVFSVMMSSRPMYMAVAEFFG